jgi:hypothetical protein
MDFWLTRLRRAEEALAHFFVEHRQKNCTGEGCALCHEFTEGVKGGLNIHSSAGDPPLAAAELPWMKILDEAGVAQIRKA